MSATRQPPARSRPPRRSLLVLAALLGAAAVVLPAVASSETAPTIEARNVVPYGHEWLPHQAAVAPGASVAFKNESEVKHGVEWVSVPATPECTGVPVGTSAAASGTHWSGSCRFTQPGTYVFYCTVHRSEMTGTVTVSANGTVTTSESPPPAPPGGSTAPQATPPASGSQTGPAQSGSSPLAGSSSQAVTLPASQHGSSVHGSVAISAAGAGGRLEVDLLAKAASLAATRPPAPARVGRFVRAGLSAGRAAFVVHLSARARHALRAHRRLRLTVKVIVTPRTGAAAAVTRTVTLHA